MYQVNLLPWRIAQLQMRYCFWRNCLFMQGLAIITGMMMMLGLWTHEQQQQQIQLSNLIHKQEKIKKTYEITHSRQVKLEKMQSIQKIWQQASLRNQRYSMLLQQLSLLIPDSCWLTAIEEHNGLLKLVANSHHHAAIMTFLRKLSEESNLEKIYIYDIKRSNHSIYHFVIHANWKIREGHHE